MTGAVILALVPVALLIALGAAMRRGAFLADAFWPQAERLGYYVLLPSLFLHSLATARLAGVPVAGLAGALVASTVVTVGALVAARRWVGGADAAFTSVFQGGVRFNSYVGVAVVAGLLGPPGVALAAVAAIVPTVNVLCVLVFARYGAGAQFTARSVGRQLAGNPLLVACAGGDCAASVRLPVAAGGGAGAAGVGGGVAAHRAAVRGGGAGSAGGAGVGAPGGSSVGVQVRGDAGHSRDGVPGAGGGGGCGGDGCAVPGDANGNVGVSPGAAAWR